MAVVLEGSRFVSLLLRFLSLVRAELTQCLYVIAVYERFGATTISLIPWLFGPPLVYTSSLKVARQIVSTQGDFEKPPEVMDFMECVYASSEIQ